MIYVVLRAKRLERSQRFIVNEFVNVWMDEGDAQKEVERLKAMGETSAFYVMEPIQ